MTSHKIVCVSPSLAAPFEPLAHRQNLVSLNIYIGISLIYAHLYWMNWFHFLLLVAGPLLILIDCMMFLSPFRHSNSFFPRTPRLWNSLTAEWFLFTYGLSGFKSRVTITSAARLFLP